MPLDLKTAMERLTAGRELLGLKHARTTLEQNEQDLSRYRDKLLGDSSAQPKADDMMVLGDNIVNHAPPTAPAAQPGGTLAKLATGAALVASGAGAGLGGSMIFDALKPAAAVVAPAPPAAQPPVAPPIAEQDAWLGFKIGKPE